MATAGTWPPEGLCEPGEVYVSGSINDQAAGKLAASFDDLGERTVKNIAKRRPRADGCFDVTRYGIAAKCLNRRALVS